MIVSDQIFCSFNACNQCLYQFRNCLKDILNNFTEEYEVLRKSHLEQLSQLVRMLRDKQLKINYLQSQLQKINPQTPIKMIQKEHHFNFCKKMYRQTIAQLIQSECEKEPQSSIQEKQRSSKILTVKNNNKQNMNTTNKNKGNQFSKIHKLKQKHKQSEIAKQDRTSSHKLVRKQCHNSITNIILNKGRKGILQRKQQKHYKYLKSKNTNYSLDLLKSDKIYLRS